VGVVAVPDDRLDHLGSLYSSERVVPAMATFVDIAGIVRGASEGEGLGNQFLAAIRECDAICQVVRAFHDDDVIHVEGKVDPDGDIATINTELILADLQTVDNRLPKLEKEARRQPALAPVVKAITAARAVLDEGRTISSAVARKELDPTHLAELQLLSAKPFIYVFNVDEGSLDDAELATSLVALVDPAPAVVLSAQLESEVAALDPADAEELLASYGKRSRASSSWSTSGSRPSGSRPSSPPDRRRRGPGPSTAATRHPRRRASSTRTSSGASSRRRS